MGSIHIAKYNMINAVRKAKKWEYGSQIVWRKIMDYEEYIIYITQLFEVKQWAGVIENGYRMVIASKLNELLWKVGCMAAAILNKYLSG